MPHQPSSWYAEQAMQDKHAKQVTCVYDATYGTYQEKPAPTQRAKEPGRKVNFKLRSI